MRSCLLLAAALTLCLSLLALAPVLLLAQGANPVAVEGILTNGTADGPTPAGLEVTLHTVHSTTDFVTATAITDVSGRFEVEAPGFDDAASYVVSLTYGGVVYGRTLDAAGLGEPVAITVYETTSDLSVLEVKSAALVLRPQPGVEKLLSGSELVSLVNVSDRTFTPDLSGQAMGRMNFMRFSLPPGATNLRLESDLAGGDVIDVGPGFAVTASVPPGDHLVGFSYVAPYDGDSLTFTRTAHMATADFHLLLPQDLARVQGDALRPGDEQVQLGDGLYQAWRAGPLAATDKVQMQLTGLPQPPWSQRLGDTLLQGTVPQLFLASLLGLALLAALLYSLLRSRPPAAAGALPALGRGAALSQQAEGSLRGLAELDDAWERGELHRDDYQARREALRAELLQAWPARGTE